MKRVEGIGPLAAVGVGVVSAAAVKLDHWALSAWLIAIVAVVVLAVPLGFRRLVDASKGWTLDDELQRSQHLVAFEVTGVVLMVVALFTTGLCLLEPELWWRLPVALGAVATLVGFPVLLFGCGRDAAIAVEDRVTRRGRMGAERTERVVGLLSPVPGGQGALSRGEGEA